MHPQKRAQMMAYLTRSGIRQDLAGGGMLVQPSADGSRPGYREDPANLKRKMDSINSYIEIFFSSFSLTSGVVLNKLKILSLFIIFYHRHKLRHGLL